MTPWCKSLRSCKWPPNGAVCSHGLLGIERPVWPGTIRDTEPADRGREQALAVARGAHPALGDRGGIGVVPAAILHPARIDVVTNPPVALR